MLPDPLFEELQTASHVLVLTGAGASAESGVPTFREAQTGLWSRYNPEELATPEAFARNPGLVWEWYAWRRSLIEAVVPNAGHHAIREWEALFPELTLITQNVDGLHQEAGSTSVIELHGNISRVKCSRCETLIPQWRHLIGDPPVCTRCGHLLRPDVVWFGETLPLGGLQAAIEAAQTCDFFFSVGTSSLVHPAASLVEFALHRRVPVVEINPQPTPLTRYATLSIQQPAGSVLDRLTKRLAQP